MSHSVTPPGTTRRLELGYRWQAPVTVTSVGAIVLVGLLVRNDPPAAGAAIALVLVTWVLLLAVVGLRTRAALELQGPTLVVRRWRRHHRLEGSQVRRVREYRTGNGPCYAVYCDEQRAPVHVPTALLTAGPGTFFGWLHRYAPQAELDPGSRRTRDRLRAGGVLP